MGDPDAVGWDDAKGDAEFWIDAKGDPGGGCLSVTGGDDGGTADVGG